MHFQWGILLRANSSISSDLAQATWAYNPDAKARLLAGTMAQLHLMYMAVQLSKPIWDRQMSRQLHTKKEAFHKRGKHRI